MRRPTQERLVAELQEMRDLATCVIDCELAHTGTEAPAELYALQTGRDLWADTVLLAELVRQFHGTGDAR